jgi:hypothetical protein
VKSILLATDTTYITTLAVKNTLLIKVVIIEATDLTKVSGKVLLTGDTSLPFLLFFTAPQTLYMLHCISI